MEQPAADPVRFDVSPPQGVAPGDIVKLMAILGRYGITIEVIEDGLQLTRLDLASLCLTESRGGRSGYRAVVWRALVNLMEEVLSA